MLGLPIQGTSFLVKKLQERVSIQSSMVRS